MSSGGQIAGGIVGGIVGFFNPVLGVAVGAQIGILVGGLLDPPKGPTVVGPRLSDLTIQTSTYGAVIPRVYGTVPIYGNVFWLENNKMHETVIKKKSGGKGGSKKKTENWVNYATFAVGLCKGPIVGVKRIWIKGELFYDAGSSDPSTMDASAAAASGFRIYKGTDTQLPDSRMQATLGAANTPAYRGLAYIVFYDLPLAAYGETIAGAQVKVEVVSAGDIGTSVRKVNLVADRYEYGIRYDKDRRRLYAIANGKAEFAGSGTIRWSDDFGYTWSTSTLTGRVWVDMQIMSGYYVAVSREGYVARSKSLSGPWSVSVGPISLVREIIKGPSGEFLITSGNDFAITTDGVGFSVNTEGSGNFNYSRLGCHNGSVYCEPRYTSGEDFLAVSSTGLTWTYPVGPSGIDDWYAVAAVNGRMVALGRTTGGVLITTISDDDGDTWSTPVTFAEHPADQDMHFITGDDVGGFCVISYSGVYWYESQDGVTWTPYSNPAGTGQSYGGGTWTGHSWVTMMQGHQQTYSKFTELKSGAISVSDVPLSTVVLSECTGSGILTGGDIDASELTDDVRGYTVASAGSIRASLTPLQAAWPFDVVQSGYMLVFVKRGGSSVASIPMSDLDARADGDSPGVQVTLSREMDTQLPRRLVIKHMDYDREYDAGEQYAERLNTDAVNVETQELAIVMTAAEAAGKAEVLLYVRWLERFDLSFNLPPTYINLEPSDVITLETTEGNVLVRLTSVNYTSDGRLECKAKYASQAVYTPAALGVPSAVTGPATIGIAGASLYSLLDVPYLHTAQADPSILAAMCGLTDNWPGGVLVRTDDSGTTWTDLQGFAAPGSTIGEAVDTIGSVDSRVWDKTSVLNVRMIHGDLSSVTEQAVLNGQNHFAYGAHGRWEIIGVQNCVLTGANTYQLYDMLRGRAGTEWAMTTHQIWDSLVPLDDTNITAIGMSSALIGLTREYRGITYDREITTDVDFPFAYNGVNLECLSPVFLKGSQNLSTGEWVLDWVRRSRTDGEWRDKVDAGLGEATESYEVDIFSDATYTTVKRTIAATSQTCTYTSAQQVTDFTAIQYKLYVKIYQMSVTVGRGYASQGLILNGYEDPYWDNVVLLMSMTGLNGGVLFPDSKGHTPIGVYGNAQTSTARSPLSIGSSGLFDGNDYITLPSSSDWAFGTGDFSIESWVYVTSLPAGGATTDLTIFSRTTGASSLRCFIDNTTGNPSIWDGTSYVISSTAVPLNTWRFVQFVRRSGTMLIGLHGVQTASVPNYTKNFTDTNEYVVGGFSGGSRGFVGNLSQLRVTKAARDIGVPSAAFSAY